MLCILTQSGFPLTPPSRDATPWIINNVLVKSKFSPLFTLAPCLYVKPSIIHSLNSSSFGLYEITLSCFFWALSEHLSSCFFLSRPLHLVVLGAALCPPVFSPPPAVVWFILSFNHDSYADNSSPDLSPLIHISWRCWSSRGGSHMDLKPTMSRAEFISH